MDDPTFLKTLLTIGLLVLLCSMPLILGSVLVFIGVTRARDALERAIIPDQEKLQERLKALRAQNPHLSSDELVHKIINRQSLKAGLIGAVTGIGGIFTLPIALPIDLAFSSKIQAALITFITKIHEPEIGAARLRVQTFSILAGQRGINPVVGSADKALQAAIRRFVLVRVGEKLAESVLKFLPFVGALVGFAINWGVTQFLGRAAVQVYTGKVERTKRWTGINLRRRSRTIWRGIRDGLKRGFLWLGRLIKKLFQLVFDLVRLPFTLVGKLTSALGRVLRRRGSQQSNSE